MHRFGIKYRYLKNKIRSVIKLVKFLDSICFYLQMYANRFVGPDASILAVEAYGAP